MIRRFLQSYANQRGSERRQDVMQALMRREAKIGGELFGPVRPGGRREFFCLDRHTWVWYEEWTDEFGQRQAVTTRYEIRPEGILKIQDGDTYHYVTPAEGKRLHEATQRYNQRIREEVYAFAL